MQFFRWYYCWEWEMALKMMETVTAVVGFKSQIRTDKPKCHHHQPNKPKHLVILSIRLSCSTQRHTNWYLAANVRTERSEKCYEEQWAEQERQRIGKEEYINKQSKSLKSQFNKCDVIAKQKNKKWVKKQENAVGKVEEIGFLAPEGVHVFF